MKNCSLLVTALVAALALLASGCQLGGSSDAEGETTTAAAAPPGANARASYGNGMASCRRGRATDMVPPLSQTIAANRDRQLATRIYLDHLRRVVRASLKPGYNFQVALRGCLKEVWPTNVSVPSRGLRTLISGEKLTFPPGVIRPEETLTCVSGGMRLKATVPPAGRMNLKHRDGTDYSAEIRITSRVDRTVLVACR